MSVNVVHVLSIDLFKTHFNIILHLLLVLPVGSSLPVSHQTPVCPPYGPYAAPVPFLLIGLACGTIEPPDNFQYPSLLRYVPERSRPPVFRVCNSFADIL
jgi:hypothetical protein